MLAMQIKWAKGTVHWYVLILQYTWCLPNDYVSEATTTFTDYLHLLHSTYLFKG